MTRLTIDDIYAQQLGHRVPDPVVAQFVLRLDDKADGFIRSAESSRWPDNYELGLEMCRITQQIRLEIGELHTLDRVSRDKIAEILKRVVDVIDDPASFVLANYPVANRKWGERALVNIVDRYEELLRNSTNAATRQPR